MCMYMICVILFAFSIQSSSAGDKGTICGPSFKKTKDGSCVQLDNSDVLRSLHWLAAPPKLPEAQKCRNVTTIGGFGVCEDLLKPDVVLDLECDFECTLQRLRCFGIREILVL